MSLFAPVPSLFFSAQQTNYICEGDSIGGPGSVDAVYQPNIGYAILGGATSFAVGGSSLPAMIARQATALAAYVTNSVNIISIDIGQNDSVALYPTSQWLIDLAGYCDTFRSAGWKVIVCTHTASAQTSNQTEFHNTVDPTIRTWVGTHSDATADFATDPNLGYGADYTNTLYFFDAFIHPSSYGNRILYENYIKSALQHFNLAPIGLFASSVLDLSISGASRAIPVTKTTTDGATHFNSAGTLIHDDLNKLPRVDYYYDGSFRGLLIEKFDIDGTALSNVLAANGMLLTPNGGVTTSFIAGLDTKVMVGHVVETTDVGVVHQAFGGFPNVYDGITRTMSVFVLPSSTARFMTLGIQNGAFASTAYAIFDLQTKTVTQSGSDNIGVLNTAGIIDYKNGLLRPYLVFNPEPSGGGFAYLGPNNLGTSANPTGQNAYTGNTSKWLDLYGWSIEKGQAQSSFIGDWSTDVFTNATFTRGRDTLSIGYPTGTTSLTYTFDDSSTQTVPVPGTSQGSSRIPTNLARPWIKTITANSSAYVYVGPGDVVGAATAWWGMRAYSAATAGGLVFRLNRFDNVQRDFSTLSNGLLDYGALQDFVGGGSATIVTWYDQTGNGDHITQGTEGKRPDFFSPVNGGNYQGTSARFYNGGQILTKAGFTSVPQPLTFSIIARRFSGFSTAGTAMQGAGGTPSIKFGAAYNRITTNAGASVDTTFQGLGNTFHSMQAVFNGVSSVLSIDNVQTATSSGASATGVSLNLGDDGTITNAFNGEILEAGLWPIGFSAGQMTSMTNNQRAWYGI